ncbi:hypothetical protein [Siphonobacter sp. SORGH_AS_0500]|uniref:hypothetical protein n=1 Tax=Siphonobacter sp. SORGH_AS_0500 TaxID=1864824 RepID=UPI0028634EBA|nr:hypothetical protein [Siphonobacter sp. SORGH_AS_0500]MDR6197963.1 hypothetical protein [Siphonobacter sp. SORGH_AS_0500]
MKSFSILVLVGVTALSSCSNETKISVIENDTSYKLDAKFDNSRTFAVREYVNDYYKPVQVIPLNSSDVTYAVTLPDHTKFRIEASKGELHLQFDKKENTPAAYARLKSFSTGLGSVITN